MSEQHENDVIPCMPGQLDDLSNHPAIEPGQRSQNEPSCLKRHSFKCKVFTSITNRIQQFRKSVEFFLKSCP